LIERKRIELDRELRSGNEINAPTEAVTEALTRWIGEHKLHKIPFKVAKHDHQSRRRKEIERHKRALQERFGVPEGSTEPHPEVDQGSPYSFVTETPSWSFEKQ
jgi:hypothetical protein